MNEKGTLYIVSTPIGNLEDMTFRAVRILKEADLILCEDTRNSIKLLNHYNIKNTLESYHKFNEKESLKKVISLLNSGKNIALISDAGTPIISDPGEILTKELIKNEIPFYVIPGANALLPALILSGFNASSFSFVGFLPKKKSLREELLMEIKSSKLSSILYLSPHEVKELLYMIEDIFTNRPLSISREITKIHEETLRGSAKEILQMLPEDVKGEMVLVIKGDESKEEVLSLDEIKQEFVNLTKQGVPSKEAIKLLSKKSSLTKRELYNALLR